LRLHPLKSLRHARNFFAQIANYRAFFVPARRTDFDNADRFVSKYQVWLTGYSLETWWIRAAALFVFVRQRSIIFCAGSSASRQKMQSESQMLIG
jgi:hypothetical protein